MHEDTELAKRIQQLAGLPLTSIPVSGINFLTAAIFYDKLLRIEELLVAPASAAKMRPKK